MRDMGILAHEHADQAYKVDDAWGDAGSVIVWARSYPEARRHGAQALDLEYESVECERYKELDSFEGDLLTWMIDRGWYFSCQECGRTCYPSDNLIRRPNDDIFCSLEHAEAYEAFWTAKRAREAEFLAFAGVKYFGYAVRINFINVEGDAYIKAEPLDRSRGEFGYPGVFIQRAELSR